MVILVVNGQNYEFPGESDPPAWGTLVLDWATAVTGVLGEVVGVGDIVQTSAAIANNVSSPAVVSGLLFNSSTVRGAVVTYSVYRVTTNSGAQELAETGQMFLSFKSTANTWDIAIAGSSSANVVFSVNSNGQVLYTSSNMTGLSYSGIIKFRASALTQ